MASHYPSYSWTLPPAKAMPALRDMLGLPVVIGDLVAHQTSGSTQFAVVDFDAARVVLEEYPGGATLGRISITVNTFKSSCVRIARELVPKPKLKPTACFCEAQALLWFGHDSSCGLAAKKR